MRKDYPKIGFWAHGMDLLLLEEVKKYDYLYFFVLSGSMLETYLRKNLREENIITLNQTSLPDVPATTFHEMIHDTDFTSVLKQNQIHHFVLPHSVSPSYEEWAKVNAIHLMEPPFDIANLFEDKIRFNQFLSEHNIPTPPFYSAEEVLKMDDAEPKGFVIQETNNFGLYGTQFFPTVASAKQHLSSLQSVSDVLIREFLNAPAFGITLFLDKKDSYFYSACRKQCYQLDNHGFPKKFLGIQWIPHDFFDSEFHKDIGHSLKNLAQMFKLHGYYSSGNLDFIVYDNKAYFLECNARLSSASAHLFGFPELTGGIDSWDFFVSSFFDANDGSQHGSSIPAGDFCGSAFDIYRKEETQLKNIPEIGTYVMRDGTVQFLGEFMDLKSGHDKRFFVTHDFTRRPQVQKDFILCSLLSNFPLFDYVTGELNDEGRRIEEYFWLSSL